MIILLKSLQTERSASWDSLGNLLDVAVRPGHLQRMKMQKKKEKPLLLTPLVFVKAQMFLCLCDASA